MKINQLTKIVKSGQDYIEFIYTTPICRERPVNDNNRPSNYLVIERNKND